MKDKSILLIDDEESLLEVLSFNLTKQGYKVETADSGEQGIQKFKSMNPDLVITDLVMEGMDGIQVLKTIKKKKPNTMVMVLTGYGSLDTAIDALRQGAYDYFQKPCDRGELAIKISKCLQKQDLEKSNRMLTEKLISLNSKLLENEKNLKVKSKRLEQSNQELEGFGSFASHDLQEPLRKIIQFGNRLQEKSADTLSEESKDYIDRMQKAASRMQQLIEILLEHSKASMEIRAFESVDLQQVVAGVVEDLEARISQTHAVINIKSLPTLKADPTHMRQLFQNLMGNSLKFHKEGTSPVLTLDSSQDDQGNWIITVKDEGIGLDEKHAERIFQPFQRLHSRGTYEGSGLGLNICQKIVSRHGGRIEVKSVPQKGATFIITLPKDQPREY